MKNRKMNFMSTKSSVSTSIKKSKKCKPLVAVRPDLIQTESVPSIGQGQHTLRVTAQSWSQLSGHTTHTPRVTVEVPVSSGHGQHTPRVTAQTRSRPSGHTTHTPRVTVEVPVSCHRLARKQNKNKLNEKMKNTKTNYRSHAKTNDLADSLPVANKLSVSRIPLSQELNSPVSLPVANKKTEDKWLTDVLTKTTKCQSAVRDILLSGHTLHTPRVTVVVPVSSQNPSGHTPHTPRVTEAVPVSGHTLSGHTLHTPRVTVVVPVSSHSPHTSRVTVGVPGSRRSRKQNKNKQNEKYKNRKSNYLSNVTLVVSSKHTKWFNHGQAHLVIPHILRESLWRSLSARVTASILRESLHKQLQVSLHTKLYNPSQVSTNSNQGHDYLVIPHILRESLCRSLSALVTASILRESLHKQSQVSALYNLAQVSTNSNHGHDYLVTPHILRESLCRSLSALVTASILRESLHKQSQVSALYNLAQVSTNSSHGYGYLVIPHILHESLCRSLSALVMASILRESLHKQSHVKVPISDKTKHTTLHKQSQVSVRSQLSGHGTAVTTLRSWSCGHGLKVIPFTSTYHTHSHHYIHSLTKLLSLPPRVHSLSRKLRNKLIKQINGNGKNSLLISHWNLGAKKWCNKRNQIQALVDTDNPDVLFISEANLDELTPSHEKFITGYEITLPKTVTRNGTARLILLTKEDLKFELVDNLMDDIVTSVWIKISRRGVKGLLVCGVYREHQYLNQVSDWSLQPAEQ